jgi:glyoxylase-like metal-dependent hydrolase (beta-lactamase superfamily II)
MESSFGSNCYIIIDKTVAIIDPGLQPERVIKETTGLHIDDLLFINTHCHFDHSGCVSKLLEKMGGKYLIHEKDAPAVENGLEEFMLTKFFGEKPFKTKVSRRLGDGDIISLGKANLEVLHTPGHTAGSICLYEPESKCLFTGDTVFSDGIGRTDFPGGSEKQLKESLVRLIKLHKERGIDRLYPGHGPAGTGSDLIRVYESYF